MKEGRTIIMREPVQGHKDLTAVVWPWCKASLVAGTRVQVVAKPAKRSTDHNARLHAMLTWISKHIDWAGKRHDADTWKRLLTAAWCRARGEPVAYLPALDGHGIDIVFRRTSELTGKEMAELIEFIFCWAAQAGYQVPEVQDGQVVYRERPQ